MSRIIFSSVTVGRIARIFRLLLFSMFLFNWLAAAPQPVRADVDVCGPIETNTTWTSAVPYVVTCNTTVVTGVTLTVQPGAVVNLNDNVTLQIDGTLVATGATFQRATTSPWTQILFTASSVDAVYDEYDNYLSGSKLQSCLIQGAGNASGAVRISGASPLIDGNTIQQNSAGGIDAVGRSSPNPVVIRNNSITSNTKSGNGAGVWVSAGLLQNNVISNNTAGAYLADSRSGGGVYASASTIETNLITNNTSYNDGGGVYASASTITGNTISGNQMGWTFAPASGGGGGIFASGSTVGQNNISGNVLNSNGDGYGGGVYITGGTLIGNTISGNSTNNVAFGYGGGAYVNLSTVSGNLVENNAAQGSGNAIGGGIYALSSTLTGNTVLGNTTSAGSDHSGVGGGVYARGGVVSDNILRYNNATGDLDSYGGGMYTRENTALGNTLSNNSAQFGGAIYAYQATITGNTILTNTTTLTGTLNIHEGTATANLLRNNSAVWGGGIYALDATLTGNTATLNEANYGGGIYAQNSNANGNTLTHNSAYTDGGGLYGRGGMFNNNTISQNSVPSYGHGSGVYLHDVGDFSYNDVVTNTASGGTAGGISIEGQPQVQYNNLYGNQPYDAEVVSTQVVTATLNYWGPLACTAIPGRIYDGNDAPPRGVMIVAPSLYQPAPIAQLGTPAGFVVTALGPDQIQVSWTPLPDIPDVGCRPPGYTGAELGYKLYYSTSGSCPPFNGSGLTQGESPIDAGSATTVTLDGFSPMSYHLSLASYDYLGRLSAYTDAVNYYPGLRILLPHVVR